MRVLVCIEAPSRAGAAADRGTRAALAEALNSVARAIQLGQVEGVIEREIMRGPRPINVTTTRMREPDTVAVDVEMLTGPLQAARARSRNRRAGCGMRE